MIYVSITTIPQRIENLNESVKSLLNQTKKPDKIFINIPFKYERLLTLLKMIKFPNLIIILLKLRDVKIVGLQQNY